MVTVVLAIPGAARYALGAMSNNPIDPAAGRAASSVESPCIGVCVLESSAPFYCRGCYRTGDEIASWRNADDGTRRQILDRVAQRRAGRRSI